MHLVQQQLNDKQIQGIPRLEGEAPGWTPPLGTKCPRESHRKSWCLNTGISSPGRKRKPFRGGRGNDKVKNGRLACLYERWKSTYINHYHHSWSLNQTGTLSPAHMTVFTHCSFLERLNKPPTIHSQECYYLLCSKLRGLYCNARPTMGDTFHCPRT